MPIKFVLAQLSGCAGCHMSVLDLYEKLLDVLPELEFAYCPTLLDVKKIPDNIDVAFLEGVVRNEHDLKVCKELRSKSKVIVAFGDCACLGSVPGLANLYEKEAILKRKFLRAESVKHGVIPTKIVPPILKEVKTVPQVISADYTLPGCPPMPNLIANGIASLLKGEGPKLPEKALCDECSLNQKKDLKKATTVQRLYRGKTKRDRCLLEQGYLCLGPATRAGCKAMCPEAGSPCTGCLGPTPNVIDQGTKALTEIASLVKCTPEELLKAVIDPVGAFYRYTLPSGIINKKARERK